MRTSKQIINWSSSFIQVNNKDTFEAISSGRQPVGNKGLNQSSAQLIDLQKPKSEIIIPKVEKIRNIMRPKRNTEIPPNYIRLRPEFNLPKPEGYELTEVDETFLKFNQNKFQVQGKTLLTKQLLTEAIIYLEKKAGKYSRAPMSNSWLKNYIQQHYKQLVKLQNYDELVQTIYGYWKNRRQQLKFPLLRLLWRPSFSDFSYILVYKSREKQKKTQKSRITVHDQLLTQLLEQNSLAIKIAERLQMLNKIKTYRIMNNIAMFDCYCSQYFTSQHSSIIKQELGDLLQNQENSRKKVRKMREEVELIKEHYQKRYDQSEHKQEEKQKGDTKASVGLFLANVVAIAHQFGINYDNVVKTPKNILDSDPQEDSSCDQTGKYEQAKDQGPKYEQNKNRMCKIFAQDGVYYQESDIVKPRNLEEYKQMQIRSYYFADDDNDEDQLTIKQRKKKISNNFKKFIEQSQKKNI